jgi:riboflavin kinase/FMN adenylyltransferase
LSSSTHIRRLIAEGDVENASAFLGHPHVLTDVVRYGYRLGRTIGTPTINMTFSDGVLIPRHGVYATRVYSGEENRSHTGVTNVGVRPTVASGDAVTAETHILDFQGNLYGRVVRIEFFSFLRPEARFDSIDRLKTQIAADCANAQAFFKELG